MLKTVNSMLNVLNKNVSFPKYFGNVPPRQEFDYNYLCNIKNLQEIGNNIQLRKGVGNIKLVNDLKIKLDKLEKDTTEFKTIQNQLNNELSKIPNRTHPNVVGYENEPKIIKHIGCERKFDSEPREFYEVTKRLNLVRTDQLGNVSGNKSYYFLGEMAKLEQALIQFTLSKLIKNNYKLISVPDILPRYVIESCGMNTKGDRTQVI